MARCLPGSGGTRNTCRTGFTSEPQRGFTLGLELVLVWMLFLPRPFPTVLFAIVTPLQFGIIATSNYAFLNYLVLVSGRSACSMTNIFGGLCPSVCGATAEESDAESARPTKFPNRRPQRVRMECLVIARDGG